MMIAAPINHICLDERGTAYIAGTRIKVRHIAVERIVCGRSPEEIKEAYPHLSLAQIYAAFAYYYDHKEQIDAEIAAADRYVEEMRARNPNPVTREQLEERLQRRKKADRP